MLAPKSHTPTRLNGLTETDLTTATAYTDARLSGWTAEPVTDHDTVDPKGYPEATLYFVRPGGGWVTLAALRRTGPTLSVTVGDEGGGEWPTLGTFPTVDAAMAVLRAWVDAREPEGDAADVASTAAGE